MTRYAGPPHREGAMIEDAAEARKQGHSKLVYDKATRTIKSVDPHPVEAEAPALLADKVAGAIVYLIQRSHEPGFDVRANAGRLRDALAALIAARPGSPTARR